MRYSVTIHGVNYYNHPRRRLHPQLSLHEPQWQCYNLTGSTVRLLIRKNQTTPPVVNIPIAGHVDAAASLTSIPLSGADTDLAIRAWQYQIILTDAHGEDRPSSVNTLRVTNLGSTTDSVMVTIGSNSVSIAMTLAGASGAGVAIGGTAGQVLSKNSTTDFDTGWHSLAKADVGLDQVNNTSDANKPVSTAMATAVVRRPLLPTSIRRTPRLPLQPVVIGNTAGAANTFSVPAGTSVRFAASTSQWRTY